MPTAASRRLPETRSDRPRSRATNPTAAGRPARLAALALTALTLSLPAACSGAQEPPRLVVLFSVCTLGTEFLSPYRTDVPFTPTLDRLAREGFVFERHHTEAGQSGTGFASIFAGTQAPEHGIYTHPNVLRDDLYLMTEAFAAEGWDPWFWWGHPMAGPDLNYHQGVPRENLVPFKDPAVARLTPVDPALTRLLERLEQDPEYRAVVQVNFSYTHEPYSEGRQPAAFEAFRERYPDHAPFDRDELERRFAILQQDPLQLMWNHAEAVERFGLTDEDVRQIDEAVRVAFKTGVHLLDLQLAQLLAAIRDRGLDDDALIAFTADHGQVLHRETAAFQWTHGLQLAPEVLHVPWIVWAPGYVPAGRFAGVTRSIDVYPTLAGLAGIDVTGRATVDGVDLSGSLLDGDREPELVAFSHSTTINPVLFDKTKRWTLFHSLFPGTGPDNLWVCARRGDSLFKLRSFPDGSWGNELFDLAADPGLTRNLFDEQLPEHAAARDELEDYKERLVRAFVASDGTARRSRVPREKSLEKLLQLGYVDDE